MRTHWGEHTCALQTVNFPAEGKNLLNHHTAAAGTTDVKQSDSDLKI